MARHALRALIWVAGWAALATFFASESWLSYLQRGNAGPFGYMLRYSLCTWGSWAMFALPVVAVARRLPVVAAAPAVPRRRGFLARRIAIYLAFAAIVVAAKLWSDAWLRTAVFHAPLRPVVGDLHRMLLTYAAIVGTVQFLELRRRAERAQKLEARLAQARMQALEARLHPHFLFNTLNAISSLVTKDPRRAEAMIARLADLLRLVLQRREEGDVLFSQELDLTQRYLAIEQTRFMDRLSVRYEIEPQTLSARLPGFVLQPLVENALRHGLWPQPAPGTLRIHAARSDGHLQVQIVDDGVGIGPSPREGLGLSSTRARLREQFGEGPWLTVADRPGGGTQVTLNIPWREAPA